jgi:hypothetical protein
MLREDYQATCDHLWAGYLKQRQNYYRSERRWLDAPFWSRRQ